MRKFLIALTALLLAGPLYAQTVLPFTRGVPSPGIVTADDVGIAFLIKYVGPATVGNSGTVEINASDVLLKVGAVGAEAADATITGCGATAGTLDTANAACNLLGELLGRINASSNWRAVPVDGMLADDVNGELLTLAATTATSENGLVVNFDTSVWFKESRCLNCPRVIGPYIARSPGFTPDLIPNPYGGKQTIVFYFDGTSTYGSGTSVGKIISAKPNYRIPTALSETFESGAGSDGTIYQLVSGATTVNKVYYNSGYGILCGFDSRCLVRIDNSAAEASVLIQAYGSTFPYVGP